MCHSTGSRPPASPVVTGKVAEHRRLEITADDGNRLSAYRATPTAPGAGNVIILPDVRGLHPFYEALAQRFAEAGFHAMVIDFYGRTAGTLPRDDSFDPMRHLPLLEAGHVDTDVAAAAALMREESPGPVFTVGFCLGGAHSWRQAATGLGLAGAIGFYGPLRFFGDATKTLSAPLLMLLAGADVVTSPAEFQTLAEGFERAGKDYTMHVYDGAPHSFFDVTFDDWEAACTDAWHRILDFTARHGHRTAA
jgi:carboxymethylenebutenolidase